MGKCEEERREPRNSRDVREATMSRMTLRRDRDGGLMLVLMPSPVQGHAHRHPEGPLLTLSMSARQAAS